MQIEINSEHKLTFIHFDPNQIQGEWLESLYFRLSEALPEYKIMEIPYGRPAKQGNSASVYICKDDEVTMSAVKKIVENCKPGGIVPLTDEEYKSITSDESFRRLD